MTSYPLFCFFLVMVFFIVTSVIVLRFIYVSRNDYSYSIRTNNISDMTGRVYVYRINNKLEYNKPSMAIPPHFRIAKTDNYYDCTCLLLESLNHSEQIMKNIKIPTNIKVIFSFKGIDFIAHKLKLTETFKKLHPDMVPLSFNLNTDMAHIERYLSRKKYRHVILKKNVQQQEGIHITNNIDNIKSIRDEYVICQELLQNPLTVSNHKINIRIYIIVATYKGNTCFFRFNDGFIYYAPLEWRMNVADMDVNITSGLKDRSLYKTNPLTYQDLLLHLGEEKSMQLDRNIQDLSIAIKTCYSDLISRKNKQMPCVCTQLLGCDVAPDNVFNVKLMEINKGPDMRFKDEIDGRLKQMLTDDYHNLLFKKKISNRLIPL